MQVLGAGGGVRVADQCAYFALMRTVRSSSSMASRIFEAEVGVGFAVARYADVSSEAGDCCRR